jgi:chromosome segregation ATPase
MWRLRRITERGWNDGFHINTRDEAQALCQLLNKLERDLNDYRNLAFQSESKLEEAQQQLLVKRSNNRRLDARNKRLECELAQETTNLHEVSSKLLKQEEDLFKAKAEIEKLREELESHAWTISPAMAQAKIDELVEQRDRLAAVLQRIRDGYGGQVASPNCCEDCDYLLPIDEALAAVKGGQS